MSIRTFNNKQDIEQAALAITRLMENWGLRPHQWMIGKQMSFFFNEIIKRPRSLIRDTNVYVLYKYLPWRCQPLARVFPPKNSKYAQQYFALQNQYNIGIDLMPLPDQHLTAGFINRHKLMVSLPGTRINIESMEKFTDRLLVLGKYFLQRDPEELRSFYFADEERYKIRLRLYGRLRRDVKTKKLQKKIDQVIQYYKDLIAMAYPELVNQHARQKILAAGQQGLKGLVAFRKHSVLTGQAVLYNTKDSYHLSKNKPIFIFSHFYPGDTPVLPLAKAVVTEGGSFLCHAAIVCREEKVPCLVGVRGIMARVKNGQKIRIDFKKGVIKLE